MNSNGRSSAVPAAVASEKDSKKTAIDRINSTEAYFGELCSLMSSFAKKSANIRDKYDEFGRIMRHIGEMEASNDSFSEGLVNYAKAMTLMADVKDMEVQRLQTKVVLELAAYESFCKNQKDALKHSISLREKEASRQQQLDQMRQRSQSRNGPTAAEAIDGSIATSAAKSGAADVDELAKRFESQKIQDVKAILLNWTAIELKQHAKAIELLTAAYQDIVNIDEDADAEDVAEKTRSKAERPLKPSHRSQSVGALTSLAAGPQLKRRNGHLSASTQSVSSPKRASGKLMVPPSPDASLQSSDRRRHSQSSSGTESDSDDDDESDGSRSDEGNKRDRSQSADDDDDEDENDCASGSAIGDQRKATAAPPVPLVRFSKLTQSHAIH